MIIYLVRHGQTLGNAKGFYQSATTPLSPEGETQAAKLAERLKDISIDEIWTSPMTRAKHTAEIINQYQNVAIKEVDGLREIKRPSSFEGKYYDDPSLKALKLEMNMGTSVAPKDPYTKFADGESVAEFLERLRRVFHDLENLAMSKPDDFSLCVTSHGYTVTTLFLLTVLEEMATPEIVNKALRAFKHENTGITLLRFPKKGKKAALTYGDFSHL